MELHKHEYTVSQKRVRPIILRKQSLMRDVQYRFRRKSTVTPHCLCHSVETSLPVRYCPALAFAEGPLKEVRLWGEGGVEGEEHFCQC